MTNLAYIALGLVVAIAAAGIIFHAGYLFRDLRDRYLELTQKVKELEEDRVAEPQVIEAKSAKQVNEEKFEEPDEESAIVVAKSPKQLRQDKDRKFDEDMERKYGR